MHRLHDARHLGDLDGDRFRQALEFVEIGTENLTEFSPLTPDTASSMLSWMYCEKLKSTPRNSPSSLSANSFTSRFLVRPAGHSSIGLSGTKNSATNEPSGSVASSPRPCSEATVTYGRITSGSPCESSPTVSTRLRGRWWGAAIRPDPEVALFKLGQEFGAELSCPNRRHDKKGQRDHGRRSRIAYRKRRAPSDRPCGSYEPRKRSRSPPACPATHGRQHRGDRKCRNHRARQRVGVCARHRTENLTLDALHCEQGQKRRDGDEHREKIDLSTSTAAASTRRSLSDKLASRSAIAASCDGRDAERYSRP